MLDRVHLLLLRCSASAARWRRISCNCSPKYTVGAICDRAARRRRDPAGASQLLEAVGHTGRTRQASRATRGRRGARRAKRSTSTSSSSASPPWSSKPIPHRVDVVVARRRPRARRTSRRLARDRADRVVARRGSRAGARRRRARGSLGDLDLSRTLPGRGPACWYRALKSKHRLPGAPGSEHGPHRGNRFSSAAE